MKPITTREVIKRLKDDGWYLERQKGSHKHFKHPTKPGITTVVEGEERIPIKTLKRIEKQSDLTLT